MQRRTAIRTLLIIGGGITLLPSCSNEPGKSSINLKNFDISNDQEKLLAEVAGTLIPSTDTPGAKDLSVHLFVLKMLDDCYEKREQQAFIKGLEQLNTIAKKSYGDTFIACAKANRESVLNNVENDKNSDAEVSTFYKIMKRRTIEGYLNSKYVMTKLIPYELVPGRYDGYVPVKKA
jgi:hypothetical protein